MRHELSSRTNEKRLDSAIEKRKDGKSFEKKLIELNQEHRLIYQVKDDAILIAECRLHYD
ncbi:MAG: type II toxin-antitoxin system YoeB family toxin [Bacteroidota bacterium]